MRWNGQRLSVCGPMRRRTARELDEFVEEYSGEDRLLEGATSHAGKVMQAAVKARLKEEVDDPEGREECDALNVSLELMEALVAAAKAAQTKLDAKVLKRCTTLTEVEIAELVVESKWMASVEGAIGQRVEWLTGELVDRIRLLESRYANALQELARQVEAYGARVEVHLKRMGLSVLVSNSISRASSSCAAVLARRHGVRALALSTARWACGTGCLDGTSWNMSKRDLIVRTMGARR